MNHWIYLILFLFFLSCQEDGEGKIMMMMMVEGYRSREIDNNAEAHVPFGR